MLNVLEITGAQFLGSARSSEGGEHFSALNPSTGDRLSPNFAYATAAEVDRACQLAAEAAAPFAALSPSVRADFLEAVAAEIEAIGDPLLERASAETALAIPRLTGERARTCGQLRMFAALVREGSWVDARVDHAQPDRKPLPKVDLRRMLRPIGPVAVFGASNFPLAFSVAGGDTASAWAAGCPVVVKAHMAHPGTSELVADAIARVVQRMGLPEGVFSMVHGANEVGGHLVKHPAIRAVGFTGSLAGGRALFDLANARPTPIPVFAEMGSVNPIFVLPGALRSGADWATAYAESLSLGLGQFCTNPGVVVGLSSVEFEAFLTKASDVLRGVPAGDMLTSGIADHYRKGTGALAEHRQVKTVVCPSNTPGNAVLPALFRTTAREFLADPTLRGEVFGPAGIAVVADSEEEMLEVARQIEGQLTASVLVGDDDASALLAILADRAGRLIYNGFPTGVEVCPSMQHGGPYPASTDSRFTSVGTAGIFRWARPVSYQNTPEALLPEELKESNPLGIRRIVDGVSVG